MTKNSELMYKLAEIFTYIEETVTERQYPPTVREIQEKFDIKSTSSVAYYLKKLEDLGYIKRTKQKSRGIELISAKQIKLRDMVQVPLVGSIPAGAPKLALEDYEDTFALPRSLFSANGELFMLKVEGTSMIDVGINDGDIIIVKSQQSAENGQIVAALVNNECATVKRFFKDEKGVRLHPENSAMSDIYPEELTILGIVVGLIRTDIR